MKVIIEKEGAKNLKFIEGKYYPVLRNFQNDQALFTTKVFLDGDNLCAEIDADKYKGLYPAIGYSIDGMECHLFAIGLCDKQNEDESIEPIK